MKKRNHKVRIIVEKTNTGFSAFCRDYPVFTTGDNIPELMYNAFEAINFYFEDQNVEIAIEDLKFEIDFKQFFQYYRVINAKFLAEKFHQRPGKNYKDQRQRNAHPERPLSQDLE